MCDKCIETAMNINPKLIEAMKALKYDFTVFEDKVKQVFDDIIKLVPVDTLDAEIEITEEEKIIIAAAHERMCGNAGMTYALYWFMANGSPDPEENAKFMRASQDMGQMAWTDGKAWNLLQTQHKH